MYTLIRFRSVISVLGFKKKINSKLPIKKKKKLQNVTQMSIQNALLILGIHKYNFIKPKTGKVYFTEKKKHGSAHLLFITYTLCR